MVDPEGNLDPGSVQEQPLVRRWAELDPKTQAALEKTSALVSKQIQQYDKRVQSVR